MTAIHLAAGPAALARRATLFCMFSSAALAQGGSCLSYGAGCAGSAGIPMLLGTRPAIGQVMNLDASGVPASSAFSFFQLGLSNTMWASTPLPLSLAPFGAPGCDLLASGDLGVFLAPSTAGNAQLQIAMPNAPGFVGFRFYGQVFPLDPAANALGLIASNGACATVGAANGGGGAINAISNLTPVAGQTITATISGFGGNPPCFMGMIPVGPVVNGQVQLQAAITPSLGTPFQVSAAPFTNWVGLGQGGRPWLPAPGINMPANAAGGVGTLPIPTNAGQGITMTVTAGTGANIQLPISIDSLGRLCIDFGAFTWAPNTSYALEIELHFDLMPSSTHCDFFATTVPIATGSSPSAGTCAATVFLWLVLNLANDPGCAGMAPSFPDPVNQPGLICLTAPVGALFTNYYPSYSHVVVK
ncbi:MAG: hypothetical protein KDC98_09940 [Planctomycetes bacterium]|nr:hypothetical protein [Planctomycetota bacterium]